MGFDWIIIVGIVALDSRFLATLKWGDHDETPPDSPQPLPPTLDVSEAYESSHKSNDFLSIDSPIDSHGLETLAIGSDISSAEPSPAPTPPPSPVAARRSASRKNKKSRWATWGHPKMRNCSPSSKSDRKQQPTHPSVFPTAFLIFFIAAFLFSHPDNTHPRLRAPYSNPTRFFVFSTGD